MVPNPFETIGAGLRQTATDLGQYGQRRSAFDEMLQRRMQAMQEQKRLEQEEKARQAKLDEEERQRKGLQDFYKSLKGEQRQKTQEAPKPYLGPGFGPSGEEVRQPPPAESETVLPTRDQQIAQAMQLGVYGDPGVRAYFDDTNPAKTLEGQKEIFGVKSAAQEKAADARMKYQSAMEEYRQGRIDARTVMTLRAAMDRAELSDKSKPKTGSGMPLKALGDTELGTLKNIQNTAYSIDKIREMAGSISSLKKGPIVGRLLGKNPYDTELQSLERLVNQTVPSLARGVFGEVGVLTDQDVERYRKMLAGVKDSPELANQIMDDLEQKIASAYNTTLDTYDQGGRDVSGFSKGLDFSGLVQGTRRQAAPPPPSPTPVPGRDPALSAAVDRSVAGIEEWERDPVTGKLRRK